MTDPGALNCRIRTKGHLYPFESGEPTQLQFSFGGSGGLLQGDPVGQHILLVLFLGVDLLDHIPEGLVEQNVDLGVLQKLFHGILGPLPGSGLILATVVI